MLRCERTTFFSWRLPPTGVKQRPGPLSSGHFCAYADRRRSEENQGHHGCFRRLRAAACRTKTTVHCGRCQARNRERHLEGDCDKKRSTTRKPRSQEAAKAKAQDPRSSLGSVIRPSSCGSRRRLDQLAEIWLTAASQYGFAHTIAQLQHRREIGAGRSDRRGNIDTD